jgi:LemA protein
VFLMGWIVLGVVIVAAFYLVSVYNQLVRLRNEVRNAFSQIDVQLKRRHDLIPNLVETAKGYMKHERQTLEAVISARDAAGRALRAVEADPTKAQTLQSLAGAEGALTAALSRLIAVAEAYPDLKANQTMSQLMEELRSTENKVSFARQGYNDSVMSYNTALESFPQNLVAGFGSFAQASSWVIERAEEREPVRVSF